MSLKKKFSSIAKILALLSVFSVSSVKATLIDLELSLVIDVSGSVDTSEYNLQMDGYAAAFRDAGVQQNIINSVHGIAVNAVFFATSTYTSVLDSFTILTTAAEANAFADILDNFTRPGSGGTNIYNGVNRAVELLLSNGLDATVGTVIDVSGDGTDTDTLNEAARDAAIGHGFTINGLPIGGQSITDFYTDHVVGGTGSFVEAAAGFDDFKDAVIRKIRTETVTTSVPEPSAVLLALFGLVIAVRRKVFA